MDDTHEVLVYLLPSEAHALLNSSWWWVPDFEKSARDSALDKLARAMGAEDRVQYLVKDMVSAE